MSRAGSIVVVVLAAVTMWLVLAWPRTPDIKDSSQVEPDPVSSAPAPPVSTTSSTAPVAPVPTPEPPPEPDEPDAPPSPASAATWPQGDILEGDRGPVEEYRKLYNSQTRDAAANDVEGAIQTAFSHADSPGLMQSASCHESICKVLIRWSPDRAADYIKATRWLALGKAWPPGQTGFDIHVAITGASDTDADGSRLVELYLKRKPRGEAPSHPH